MAKKTPVTDESRQVLAENAQSRQLYAISQYVSKVKFAPRLLGVDEADVWRKTEKLCELYEDALTAERMRSAQLEQECAQLRDNAARMGRQYRALEEKAKQLLAAYQSLAGKGGGHG